MSHPSEGKPRTFLDSNLLRLYCTSPGHLLNPQVTREGWSQTGELAVTIMNLKSFSQHHIDVVNSLNSSNWLIILSSNLLSLAGSIQQWWWMIVFCLCWIMRDRMQAELQGGASRSQPSRQGYCGYCRVLYRNLDQVRRPQLNISFPRIRHVSRYFLCLPSAPGQSKTSGLC